MLKNVSRNAYLQMILYIYYVVIEDLFSAIKRAHIATGYGDRDRMLEHIDTKYANIGRE